METHSPAETPWMPDVLIVDNDDEAAAGVFKEIVQRFPDGRPRDSEPLGQRNLVQPVAGKKLPRDDGVLDRLLEFERLAHLPALPPHRLSIAQYAGDVLSYAIM